MALAPQGHPALSPIDEELASNRNASAKSKTTSREHWSPSKDDHTTGSVFIVGSSSKQPHIPIHLPHDLEGGAHMPSSSKNASAGPYDWPIHRSSFASSSSLSLGVISTDQGGSNTSSRVITPSIDESPLPHPEIDAALHTHHVDNMEKTTYFGYSTTSLSANDLQPTGLSPEGKAESQMSHLSESVEVCPEPNTPSTKGVKSSPEIPATRPMLYSE
jgi:hypothetical protein